MARPEVERTANEESDDHSPGIGTDPARTPQEDGEAKKQVSLDEEKVRKHEKEKDHSENESSG